MILHELKINLHLVPTKLAWPEQAPFNFIKSQLTSNLIIIGKVTMVIRAWNNLNYYMTHPPN